MAVTALGHTGQGPDGTAFQFILADPIALAVKLACVADLMDPVQLAKLDPFTRRRQEAAGTAAALKLGTTLPRLLANRGPGPILT